MKYTIEGFSQAELVRLKLDHTDAILLRWFADFHQTGRMDEFRGHDGKTYYWVKYSKVIEELPILGLNSPDVVARRLRRLVDSGVMLHYHHSVGGSYSTFRIGPGFEALVTSTPSDSKVGPLRPESRTPSDSKVGPKILLPEDPSTKEQEPPTPMGESASLFDQTPPETPGPSKPTAENVIAYLNQKAGKNFKAVNGNATLVRARIKEGYTLADFQAVIDKRTARWGKDPKMREYLRPETLFSTKHFESYLNDDLQTGQTDEEALRERIAKLTGKA